MGAFSFCSHFGINSNILPVTVVPAMVRSKLSAKRFWELRKQVVKACIIHRGNGKGMEPVARDATKRIFKVL